MLPPPLPSPPPLLSLFPFPAPPPLLPSHLSLFFPKHSPPFSSLSAPLLSCLLFYPKYLPFLALPDFALGLAFTNVKIFTLRGNRVSLFVLIENTLM